MKETLIDLLPPLITGGIAYQITRTIENKYQAFRHRRDYETVELTKNEVFELIQQQPDEKVFPVTRRKPNT